MKTFDYTPFTDIYIPYLDQPELSYRQREKLWRELINRSALPVFTKWVLYRAIRSNNR